VSRNLERRREREAEWEAECAAREAEEARVAALPLYFRINEAESIADIKAILRIIIEKLELE
jgi:hypothetical protein